MVWVHTPSRKSSLCEIMMRHLSYVLRYSSSHTHASRSRWLVGSSSSSKVGRTNSARASATRMRHPPDMSLVDRAIICLLKPRPCSSSAARTSKVEGSSSSMRS
mmetsp:Transcript_32749/g.83669  ORF Transcript_32749/g.83669 Transcript_32749/m.83669 type:complete len:104 (-) Transcript_32749:711-1022(-)